MERVLIEGSDYFLHFIRFANKANPAIAVKNEDGTFDVYCNTLYDVFALRDALPHEFIHIAEDHLYLDLPVHLLEEAADRHADRVTPLDCGVIVTVNNRL